MPSFIQSKQSSNLVEYIHVSFKELRQVELLCPYGVDRVGSLEDEKTHLHTVLIIFQSQRQTVEYV